MKNPRSVVITGGSSGIGKALCCEYAKSGVTISFTGRNSERLAETSDEVMAKGATAVAENIDVTDSEAMKKWIEDVDRRSPIDLVIANAGIGTPPDMSLDESTKEVFDTNVYGVFNTVHPTLELMKDRGRGQVAIVSSIAGFVGMPSSPSYSTSKATVRHYGKALRNRYADKGIEINVICPGWVLTPMTEPHKETIPFFASMENTTRLIRVGLEKNKGLIAFPHGLAFWIWCLSTLPDSLQDFILRRVGK